MGVIYVVVALIVIIFNVKLLPGVIGQIFADAFNFKAIFGGVAGSCMMYGIKRGLYSNEAGVGSAPNAAAAADVSHPVKQGLVQMFSVFLDTIIICTATAMMCMCSGVEPSADIAGAMYVQLSVSSVLGGFGPIFVTVSLMLFGFTTLIGNLYYCNNALAFINNNKMPGKNFMMGFYIVCAVLIFVGAGLSMGLAWSIADILQAIMCLINIPTCIILGKVVYAACADYIKQKQAGQNPVFHAKAIGMDDSKLDFWK
jgi:AGCS family alanine or glycine:cation symporter